jgi:predicted DsbA family dithiol-disulfide isomerase
MSREDYLIAKFGSVERYNANNNRVVEAAAAVGLDYNRERIMRQPNTLDCHRLILWAGEAGKAGAMKQRLMEIYFSEGGDLSVSEVLIGAAVNCGMDGDQVRERLASQQDVAQVEREAKSANEAGIEGVPCFIIGGMIALNGAQPPEYLAAAIERAAAEQAGRVAAE